jgi:aspartyl-tRNA(Asn)/glutamyl-tRNA(Gln) amidotransferase subunit C
LTELCLIPYLYPMKVDEALIDRLATLARLHFSDEEKATFKDDFSTILSFVDKLKELEVQDLEPLIHISERVNVLRADEVKTEITHEEALLNAPQADSDYFKVPKVLKK